MGGFGFAAPLQRRLPLATGPGDPGTPQNQGDPPVLKGGSLSGDVGQAKSLLQNLGIMKTPMPGSALPSATSAAAPDAAASATGDAAASTADAGASGAASGVGDALSSAGSDIGDLIAELFL